MRKPKVGETVIIANSRGHAFNIGEKILVTELRSHIEAFIGLRNSGFGSFTQFIHFNQICFPTIKLNKKTKIL